MLISTCKCFNNRFFRKIDKPLMTSNNSINCNYIGVMLEIHNEDLISWDVESVILIFEKVRELNVINFHSVLWRQQQFNFNNQTRCCLVRVLWIVGFDYSLIYQTQSKELPELFVESYFSPLDWIWKCDWKNISSKHNVLFVTGNGALGTEVDLIAVGHLFRADWSGRHEICIGFWHFNNISGRTETDNMRI